MDSNTPLQPLPPNFHRTTARTTLKFILAHPLVCTLLGAATFLQALSTQVPLLFSVVYATALFVPSYWVLVSLASAYGYHLFGSKLPPDNLSLLGSQAKLLAQFVISALHPNHPLAWVKAGAALLGYSLLMTGLIAFSSPGPTQALSTPEADPLWLVAIQTSWAYWVALYLGWRTAFMLIEYGRHRLFDFKLSILAPSALGVFRDPHIAGLTAQTICSINNRKTLLKTFATWGGLRTVLAPIGLGPLVDGVWIAAILKASEGGSTSWVMNTAAPKAQTGPQPQPT